MKKIVALVMILSMLLSCTAFAATKTSTQTVAQLYINPQLVADEEEAVQTLVETINSLTFTTTQGENVVTVSYGANDVDICEYTVATTEEGGLLLFSSLYPNTAVLLDFAKVAALVEQVLPIDLEEVMLQAQSAGTEIAAMLEPYLTDVDALISTLQSEVVVDESNMNAYLSLTSKHLAQLLDAWLTRLAADANMQSILSAVYAAAMESSYDAPSFSEFLTQLQSEVTALKNSEEVMELGTVGAYQGEDGSVCYEVTLANQLLISADVYSYDGYNFLDLMVLTNSGLENWQDVYDGICAGTNYNDVMFGVDFTEGTDYVGAQLYMTQSGTTVALSVEETVENAFTDEQKITTLISLDMSVGEESINLGGIAAETVLVDDYTMPSLSDKYVLDVFAMPVDMLMNGLPQFAENIVAGMPEMVNLVLGELSQVEGLEFLQLLVIPVTETVEITEEAAEITTGEVTTEYIPVNEAAPTAVPQMDGVIEDQ